MGSVLADGFVLEELAGSCCDQHEPVFFLHDVLDSPFEHLLS